MRTVALIIGIALLPLSAAAQTVVVLDADFNADIVGEPPDESLPEPPEGDAIDLLGQSSNGIFRVVESAATLTNQPLEVTRVGGTIGLGCAFLLPTTAFSCQDMIFRWCAVAVTDIPTTFFKLLGPAGQFDFEGIVNLRADGSITISPESGESNEISVGTWTRGVAQCFEWHIDRNTGLQSLFIDGSPAIEDLQTSWNTSGELTRLQYSMAAQDQFTYALDDVEVLVVNCDGVVAVEPGTGHVPGASALEILALAPNPLNPSTEVSFENRGSGPVTMQIYNVVGRQVSTVPLGDLGPGLHRARWNGRSSSGRDLPSGVYFVRLRGPGGETRAVKALVGR